MSITIKSTHKLKIGNAVHDLTTEELLELRDQIDSALATKRGHHFEDWKPYTSPHPQWPIPIETVKKHWGIPPVTCNEKLDETRFWPGVQSDKCGAVLAAQTHVQP
jgi:hypothetical protein